MLGQYCQILVLYHFNVNKFYQYDNYFVLGYIGYRFWTSGTNLADKRKWVWSSTGNDVTFFKWAPGEPNNALENSENCLEAGWYKNEQALIWNDIRCSGIELHFICEATTDCHNLHC